jgi:hypothetical protein
MLRNQYLALPRVSDFIDWLASNLDHVSLFAHSYYERRQKVTKTFSNLPDANAQYFWKHKGAVGTPSGTCLTSSHAALEALCDALHTGINTANDASTLDASMRVMEWGGVSAGNVRWLTVNAKDLVRTLASTTAALASDNLAHPILTTDRELRFNAGMTKVYSLLVNDFIIYDSRVAAALGWIVVKYCKDRSLPVLPAELAFPWAPAKEAPNALRPKNRDPSQSPYHFPRLIAGELHAVWNLKASWILAEVLARAPASYFNGTSPIPALRRLEAALFMIGYDLPMKRPAGGAAGHTHDAVGNDWAECYTAAKGKRFHYRIEAGGIRLHDRRFFPTTIINKTLNILREQFGNRSFPLANSATAVRSGKARPGIGRAYFDATAKTGNPPSSSALAAVLHELGVLNHQSGSLEPWSINPSEFADQAEIDVSALFARFLELNDSL